ncbi:peptidoglycan DD-metalloendopeptidase family protein [Paracoccus cavernae]|uniref:Peptidoglycan DD-metalloendopeptidase family protein n=1 Tax=Paracoccus cavernae TaxID=1571207 RepID=A0ABT8D6N4_9RHOB|nr:peptidoglycan DD-metalloendopeptidase family protein [Paracoccus cavernae]
MIATAPAALVTTPWPATIRYRGPLLDYGNVTILEPAQGYLLVAAGMSQVFGEVGDVLAAGEPVGLMGGKEGSAQEFGIGFVQGAAAGNDADLTQTLYLELRKGKETLDPADWFVMNPIVGDTGQDGTTE